MADPDYIFVASGTTNTAPDSNVDVYINGITLGWEIQDNLYGDKLPIIPKESRVEHGKILYRLKIKVTLHSLGTNRPVAGKSVAIRSNRAGDTVKVTPSVSDASGSMMVTLETREPGELRLSLDNNDITASPLAINLRDAWYEAGFKITHYIVADENDYSGDAMSFGSGLKEPHRDGFLYGATGVPMQGTGKSTTGQYIHFDGGGGGWHNNEAHNPDRLNDPDSAHFSYQSNAGGRSATVEADHSIAVDTSVIPGRAHVHIQSQDGKRVVGDRVADDTGGGIRGFHIDHFSGLGRAANKRWKELGSDMENARVKYLGG